jgi:hypothetical protein
MAKSQSTTKDRANLLAISRKARVMLSRCAVIGDDAIRLGGHPGHADRIEAERIIVALGGQFAKDRAAYVFADGHAGELLDTALVVGHVVDKPRRFDFYNTPEPLAARLVKLANIDNSVERILEPSAGSGSILRLLPDRADFCELQHDKRERIARQRNGSNVGVIAAADFFDVTKRSYDRIVAAPPLSNNADIRHVDHMLSVIRPGGRIVTLINYHFEHRDDEVGTRLLDKMASRSQWQLVPLPAGSLGRGVGPAVSILIADRHDWT